MKQSINTTVEKKGILAGNGESITVLEESRNLGHGVQAKVIYSDGTEGWEHVEDILYSTTGEQEVKSLHTLGEWRFDNSDYIPDVYGFQVSEISVPGEWIAYVRGDSKEIREANAAHIVKCVNAHDELVRENKRLTDMLACYRDFIAQQQIKIFDLKDSITQK